ncbi:hypothetical protein RB195_024576 [Necator americanus]|uniref:Peptidase A2 domain-containing protein n=1 Tax=Necator americanus TaxID=51031 RepID=A0ABR1ENU7_NECAM
MEIGKLTQHIQAMWFHVLFSNIATQYNAGDCATRSVTLLLSIIQYDIEAQTFHPAREMYKGHRRKQSGDFAYINLLLRLVTQYLRFNSRIASVLDFINSFIVQYRMAVRKELKASNYPHLVHRHQHRIQQRPVVKRNAQPIAKPHQKSTAKPSKAAVTTIQSNTRSGVDNMTEEENDPTKTIFNTQVSDRPYLLTGEITVMDIETRAKSKVDVLLDTGAETSFIDSSLAKRLHLPIFEQKTVRLRTFGAKEAKCEKCGLVKLEGWDEEGTKHLLDLLTY